MFPGESSCIFVGCRGAPSCTPKDDHVMFKSRHARTRCEISKAELSTKKKSRPSQVYQSAGTQVVTEFRGPLDNGQRSTKFWLPPALFSRVRSLRVATVAVACSQVGPGVFLLVFLAPLMHPQRRSARHSSRVTCASATRIAEQNAARKKNLRRCMCSKAQVPKW